MRKGGRVTSVGTIDCEVKFKGWLRKFDLEVVIFSRQCLLEWMQHTGSECRGACLGSQGAVV